MLEEILQLAPSIVSYSSVIHNGLKIPELQPLPISFTPPRLLCIGRLVPQKGFDLAIKAIRSLTKEYPRIKMIIAGEGPIRAELEQLTIDLELSQSVEFLGVVDPEMIPELINNSTIVIMPSRYESFGLVALQTAQMERPIVATRIGGLPEIILNNKTGLLVEKKTSKVL